MFISILVDFGGLSRREVTLGGLNRASLPRSKARKLVREARTRKPGASASTPHQVSPRDAVGESCRRLPKRNVPIFPCRRGSLESIWPGTRHRNAAPVKRPPLG